MPVRFYAKVCGLTNPEDAARAVSFGADFLGMVFHPDSPRLCTPDAARQIKQEHPSVPRVLVFGYDDFDYILEMYKLLRDMMTFVQIPSDHPHFREIREKLSPAKIFPVVYPEKPLTNEDMKPFEAHSMMIMDTPKIKDGKKLAGGAGETFAWENIREIERPYLLAGGLNPNNLCDALRALEPFGVDVSSGLELSPGIKDPDKLKSFFHILGGYPENCPEA